MFFLVLHSTFSLYIRQVVAQTNHFIYDGPGLKVTKTLFAFRESLTRPVFMDFNRVFKANDRF